MNVDARINLNMSQRLVMTPMLQQAIKLLQMSRIELVDLVRQEMLENPVLDEVEESLESNLELPDEHSLKIESNSLEERIQGSQDGVDGQPNQPEEQNTQWD